MTSQHRGLACEYRVAPATGIIVEWRIEGIACLEQKTYVNKILHGNINTRTIPIPPVIKRALVYALIPQALVQQPEMESMLREAALGKELKCHGLFTTKKPKAGHKYETARLPGRQVEVIKMAHIIDKTWLVLPCNSLQHNFMYPTELPSKGELKAGAKEGHQDKKRKLAQPKTDEKLPRTILKRKRDELFAMATFKAELVRAAKTKTEINLAVAHKRFVKLRTEKSPKNVFVLWSSTTREGCVEEYAEQVPFHHVWDVRL